MVNPKYSSAGLTDRTGECTSYSKTSKKFSEEF